MSHVLAAYQYERPYEVGILFIMLCLSPKQLNVFFFGFSLTHLTYCSQELLEAIEHERNMQANRAHTTTAAAAAVFHHPVLGDFEV
jgi:hypothetical protein